MTLDKGDISVPSKTEQKKLPLALHDNLPRVTVTAQSSFVGIVLIYPRIPAKLFALLILIHIAKSFLRS